MPHPVHPHRRLHITWGQDNLPYWYLLLVMLVIVVVLFYRLEGSRLGRAWAAIREDEVAAQATGVNTTRVKLLAFAIGASTSALAGVFFASQVGYFDPTLFTLQHSILIVAYVVFGGMGSLPGAMAGAAVLTWLPQFLKDQVPQDDRQMWIGALVLAMMIFRPAGLLPGQAAQGRAARASTAPTSPRSRAVPAAEGCDDDRTTGPQRRRATSSSTSSTSRCASAAWSASTTCRCRCTAARSSPSSARTAPARRRCSTR